MHEAGIVTLERICSMDNTVNDPEVERLSVMVSKKAKRLRRVNPTHPLLAWYEKLWESDNLPEQIVRLRTRIFVHRFTTDPEARKYFMVDDQIKTDVLVEYLGALEDALFNVTN